MATGVALDTNAYSDFARGVPERVQIVQSASHLYLPLIVLGELRAGFRAGNRQNLNEARLNRFVSSSRVSILLPDSETTAFYAELFSALRQKGSPIPTNDLWIAALVRQHNLPLCTNDAHFRLIPNIEIC